MFLIRTLGYEDKFHLEPAGKTSGDGLLPQEEANQVLSPRPDQHCVGMLTTNLAYPEWVSVSCNRSLVSVLFCQQRNKNQTNPVLGNFTAPTLSCDKSDIYNKKCFQFRWIPCQRPNLVAHVKHNTDIQKFQYLFDAISSPINMFIHNLSNFVTVRRFIKKYSYEHHSSDNTTQGFLIRSAPFLFIRIGSNVFKCASKVHISISSICNGILDCPGKDDSDEVGCNCTEHGQENEKCKYISKAKQICSFFYQQINRMCLLFGWHVQIFPDTPRKYQHSTSLLCMSGITISSALMNDLVPDCGPQAEDEVHLKEALASGVGFSCVKPGQIPCRQRHTKCYQVSHICSFKLDKYGNLSPCRTGEHVESCEEFPCNLKFKCQKSYCIPYSYICDGKWDCLHGEDEILHKSLKKLNFLNCVGMFKCAKVVSCLHMADLCDGIKDCLLGDDELFCTLASVMCPLFCFCLTYVVKCVNFSYLSVPNLHPYLVIQMKHPTFFQHLPERKTGSDYVWNVAKTLQNAHRLILSTNKIQHICSLLSYAVFVVDLDLSINKIRKISGGCFKNQPKMEFLNLNNNKISQILKGAFGHQKALRNLDLSHNNLKSFPSHIFHDNVKLLLLNMAQNTLSDIKPVAFHLIHIKLLLSMKYHVCCVAECAQICIANKPWFVSCHNLIPTLPLVFCIYFTAATILVLNGILFLVNQIPHDRNIHKVRTSGMAMTSIWVADLLCGIHLVMLSVANTYYGQNFILVESVWRRSVMCTNIFAVALWYSILSPALLMFLSVSRTITILTPLNAKIKSVTFNIACIVVNYMVTFVIVCLIILWKMYWSIVLTFNLCSPFVDPLNEIQMVKVTIILTVIVQLIALAVITISNSFLVQFIFRSSKDVEKYSQKRQSRKSIYVQIFMLTGTNILCWIPVNIIFILLMLSEQFSLKLLIWAIVVMVPINSIVNPTIFLVKTFRVVVSKVRIKYLSEHTSERIDSKPAL